MPFWDTALWPREETLLAAGSQCQALVTAEHGPPAAPTDRRWQGASHYQEPSGAPTSPEKEALEGHRQEGEPMPCAAGHRLCPAPPSKGKTADVRCPRRASLSCALCSSSPVAGKAKT